MRSALYYPHTHVVNKSLVKTALLLWDQLEFIVPYSGFRSHYADSQIQRAMEMIGAPHIPGTAEKEQTHKRVRELVNRRLPLQFYFSKNRSGPRRDYEIYPQKLYPETWQLLRNAQLSGELRRNADYPMTEAGGLTIMSILADCCAGKTRSRITDRGPAYATLAGFLGDDSGDASQSAKASEEQLVPITLQVIDAPSIDIRKLIKFREREQKQAGHAIRDLRHRYVDGLEKYVKQLTTEKGSASDAKEIKRQFADDMKIDFENLKDEIGFARKEALFSKEILLAALAGIGTIASATFALPLPILGTITATGAPATIGGVLGARNKYLSARRTILQKHPMAYLYELQK